MARSILGRNNKGFPVFFRFVALIVGIILLILLFQGFFGKNAKISSFIKISKKNSLDGNYNGAMEQIKKALQLDSSNPIIYDAMGFSNNLKGDTEQAKFFYQTAVEKGLIYNSRFEHKKIGNDFISKGKYPQALVEFEHYAALKPGDKTVCLDLP